MDREKAESIALRNNHLKIIVALSDNTGHSNKQLSIQLGMKKTNLSNYLTYLRRNKIVFKGNGKPTYLGKEYEEIPLFLGPGGQASKEEKLNNLDLIIRDLLTNQDEVLQKDFLDSAYFDELIRECGFLPILNLMKFHFENLKFKKLATQALLNKQIIIDNYKNNIKSHREDIWRNLNIMQYHPCCGYEMIKGLKDLDQLGAIIFYREIIKNRYVKVYRAINQKYLPNHLKKLLEFDIELSPFSSFPHNDPIELLFADPFKRLYHDTYIIDEVDFDKLIARAYLIHSNFAEVLAFGLYHFRWDAIDRTDYDIVCTEARSGGNSSEEEELRSRMEYLTGKFDSLRSHPKSLDNILKIAIFHWNITADRFDGVCTRLEKEVSKIRMGKCHIYEDGGDIKIVNLQTNTPIFDRDSQDHLEKPYFLRDFFLDDANDPLESLLPCKTFNSLGLKIEIPSYEKLLSEFNAHVRGLRNWKY